MARRALIAILIAAAVLAAIDRASSFFIPCPNQQIVPTASDHKDQNKDEQKTCSTPGVIVQGMALIWNTVAEWRPDVWSALATIAVAAFTLVLAVATNVQAGLTRDAIQVARDEFNATHRPRFEMSFLRRVAEDAGRSLDNQPIAVQFRVENVGTGKGTIAGAAVVLDFYPDGLLPQPDDLPRSDLMDHITFDKGAGWQFTVRNPQLGSLIEIYEEGLQYLYLIGWIVYEDPLGPQTTYFCRRYEGATNRFSRVTTSDYERDGNHRNNSAPPRPA